MELMAPIQGLLVLKEPCEVEITTDSEYVFYGVTKWITKWKRRHWWWKNEPVRNADLWMELDQLAALYKTRWVWTRGMPATRTTPGATGWRKMRQPLSEVLGQMAGRTHPCASAWVRITCRPNPRSASSMT
jgi:hypothetical protein